MSIIKLQGEYEKRKGIYYEYDVDATPLGEGGMGRVFKGFRVVERTGERTPVAIKAIYENIPERVVERARREAEIQLENDNLIRMFGFVETYTPVGSGSRIHYHVIMELLVGVTLEDLINGITCNRNGIQIPFAAELYSQYLQNRDVAVVRIMKAILSGLMALHDKGYIHRDIDPSNIMITIDGKIKLIDFGICKQIVSLESIDKALTATGVFMGKVNYAAPELVLGDVKSQNYTTDIYALGILLYQLCSGHLPFSGTDQDVLAANLRSALPMKDIHNRNFKRIIRKATEKIQSKRYASVAELRVDLERIILSGGDTSKNKWGIISGVVIIIALAIGCICYFAKDNGDRDNQETVMTLLSNEELFGRALNLLEQRDSIPQGKESLRVLAEDSSYAPAQLKYYVLLLNSNNSEDVKKGFEGLLEIVGKDSLNHTALFECGLTLSQKNSFFTVPSDRQTLLDISTDLDKGNELLYRAMKIDSTDYKSVYWMFNNLIQKKIEGSLSSNGDKQIIDLFYLFEKRSANAVDEAVKIYREAIKSDEETLRAWGLIK